MISHAQALFDYVDPAQSIMAVGSTVSGMSMGLYSYKEVESTGLINRDFSDIKVDGKIYCIDSTIRAIYLGCQGRHGPVWGALRCCSS